MRFAAIEIGDAHLRHFCRRGHRAFLAQTRNLKTKLEIDCFVRSMGFERFLSTYGQHFRSTTGAGLVERDVAKTARRIDEPCKSNAFASGKVARDALKDPTVPAWAGIVPKHKEVFGRSYQQWIVAAHRRLMSLPCTASPFVPSPKWSRDKKLVYLGMSACKPGAPNYLRRRIVVDEGNFFFRHCILGCSDRDRGVQNGAAIQISFSGLLSTKMLRIPNGSNSMVFCSPDFLDFG